MLASSISNFTHQLKRNQTHNTNTLNAFINTIQSTNTNTNTLTLALKDIFSLKDHPNTCASKTLKDFKPTYDATVVSKIRQSSTINIIGKTNMDEFSMGSASCSSYFGRVINPASFSSDGTLIEARSAGGSSGGSAAAVASGMCDLALGSDTGGSTRLPAAYCGIVGLKPSYGLISRYGMVAYAHSLDTVGLMARSIDSLRPLLQSLIGFDARDPTSVAKKLEWTDRGPDDLSDLTIGLPVEYFISDLQPDVLNQLRGAVSKLKARGAKLVSVSLPSTAHSLGAYYVIASSEASSNLARFSGLHYGFRHSLDQITDTDTKGRTESLFVESRSAGFGDEVKRRILLGTYALSASGMKNYFLKAQHIRQRVRQEFENLWNGSIPSSMVDLLLTPPALSIPPRLESGGERSWAQDQLLVPASLAGLPGLVVPVGKVEDRWPVGVQLIGPWGSESVLMRVGKAVEDDRVT